MIGLGLEGYDPDSQYDAAVAFRIQVYWVTHLGTAAAHVPYTVLLTTTPAQVTVSTRGVI